MCRNLADQYEFDSSNFHKLAETKLKRYQKIVSRNNESLKFENYSYAEVVVPKIYYIAKYVQEREGPTFFIRRIRDVTFYERSSI